MFLRNLPQTSRLLLLATLLTFTAMVSTSNGSQNSSTEPMEIAEDVICAKCGMFPAKYPQWQTQVIFSDGKMAAFDGCKCMFGFLFNMDQYDKEHTSNDVTAILIREFKSGDWVDAKKAYYVIGSDKMGPMGKELIPFIDTASAEGFQKEHGGQVAQYDAISMETLKPLMGKMHMKGKMNE